MVFFPLDFVLRGFPVAEYELYALPKTLVRPCPAKKILIYKLALDCFFPSLAASFIRLWRDHTVLKKDYPFRSPRRRFYPPAC